MNDRDEELDLILAPLRNECPTDLETRRWQRALDGMTTRRGADSKRRLILQLAAASLVGGLIGAALMSAFRTSNASSNDRFFTQETASDATMERIYVKLN